MAYRLLILLLVLGVEVKAQRIVKDSVYFRSDTWCQSPDSEAKQRAEILGYEKKIKNLKNLIHEKKSVERSIDSLITHIDSIEVITDSLKSLHVKAIELTVDECKYRERYLVDRNNNLQEKLLLMYRKEEKIKRVRKGSLSLNAILFLILLI